MIDKFYIWVGKNCKTIGLAIVILMLLTSVTSFLAGDITSGALALAVSFLILMDLRDMT